MHRIVREIFGFLSCAIWRLDRIFDHLQNFSVRKQRKHWSNMARFSGIYRLYVNNCVQKTYKNRFGYRRPGVLISTLRPKTEREPRGAFHKAGFACREKQKEYGQFVRTPFHMPWFARYSVLHLLGVLSGGNEPPLCKGRWLA